jgi:hypothetical protein
MGRETYPSFLDAYRRDDIVWIANSTESRDITLICYRERRQLHAFYSPSYSPSQGLTNTKGATYRVYGASPIPVEVPRLQQCHPFALSMFCESLSEELPRKELRIFQDIIINPAGSVDKSTNALTIRLKIVQARLFILEHGQRPNVGARLE